MQILALGQGTKLIKIDLKDAYHINPVHPTNVHLLGISWQGATYVDRALPFGLRSAPKIFTAVSVMIAWALHCQDLHDQIHYLDYFLLLVHPSSDQGEAVLSTALRTLDYFSLRSSSFTSQSGGTINCAGIFGHHDRHKSTGTAFTTAKTKEYKGPGAAVAKAQGLHPERT